MKQFLSVLLTGLLATPAAHAWNASGHKTIALVAYQNLTPATKQRVDTLLSNHPDYPKWIEGAATPDRGLVAFIKCVRLGGSDSQRSTIS